MICMLAKSLIYLERVQFMCKCFNGKIADDRVIDHINNNRKDRHDGINLDK